MSARPTTSSPSGGAITGANLAIAALQWDCGSSPHHAGGSMCRSALTAASSREQQRSNDHPTTHSRATLAVPPIEVGARVHNPAAGEPAAGRPQLEVQMAALRVPALAH